MRKEIGNSRGTCLNGDKTGHSTWWTEESGSSVHLHAGMTESTFPSFLPVQYLRGSSLRNPVSQKPPSDRADGGFFWGKLAGSFTAAVPKATVLLQHCFPRKMPLLKHSPYVSTSKETRPQSITAQMRLPLPRSYIGPPQANDPRKRRHKASLIIYKE